MFSKSTVKYIQSLQHKKFREEHGVFVAEGPKIVHELLDTGYFQCEQIYATKAWEAHADQNLLKEYRSKIEWIEDFQLEKISGLSQHNQVLGVFKKNKEVLDIDARDKLVLVLDQVQDPGNLGTIIRIADWFGISQIVCSRDTADFYNPKVVQSTMASLGRVQLLYTDIEDWLKKTPVKKYAAALHGKDLHLVGKPTEAIIIIGNESKGISAKILSLADEKITIPRFGSAESLNAAVATGIILYALHA